jgi:hypothetical protein
MKPLDMLIVIGITMFLMFAGLGLYHMYIMDLMARSLLKVLMYLNTIHGGVLNGKEVQEGVFVQRFHGPNNGQGKEERRAS